VDKRGLKGIAEIVSGEVTASLPDGRQVSNLHFKLPLKGLFNLLNNQAKFLD